MVTAPMVVHNSNPSTSGRRTSSSCASFSYPASGPDMADHHHHHQAYDDDDNDEHDDDDTNIVARDEEERRKRKELEQSSDDGSSDVRDQDEFISDSRIPDLKQEAGLGTTQDVRTETRTSSRCTSTLLAAASHLMACSADADAGAAHSEVASKEKKKVPAGDVTYGSHPAVRHPQESAAQLDGASTVDVVPASLRTQADQAQHFSLSDSTNFHSIQNSNNDNVPTVRHSFYLTSTTTITTMTEIQSTSLSQGSSGFRKEQDEQQQHRQVPQSAIHDGYRDDVESKGQQPRDDAKQLRYRSTPTTKFDSTSTTAQASSSPSSRLGAAKATARIQIEKEEPLPYGLPSPALSSECFGSKKLPQELPPSPLVTPPIKSQDPKRRADSMGTPLQEPAVFIQNDVQSSRQPLLAASLLPSPRRSETKPAASTPMASPPATSAAAASQSSAGASVSAKKGVPHLYHDYSQVPDEEGLAYSIRRKTGGVTQPFPEKLYEMLQALEDDPSSQEIVSWLPHGRAFLVHKPKEFTVNIMPRFFRQTKLTSFQRQLNLYGFRRLTQGVDSGAYYHELFLRGRPSLCQRMVRQKIKGTGHKQPADASSEPNFYIMTSLDVHGPSSTDTALRAPSVEQNRPGMPPCSADDTSAYFLPKVPADETSAPDPSHDLYGRQSTNMTAAVAASIQDSASAALATPMSPGMQSLRGAAHLLHGIAMGNNRFPVVGLTSDSAGANKGDDEDLQLRYSSTNSSRSGGGDRGNNRYPQHPDPSRSTYK